jgi:hypothetical protein
MPFPSDTKPMIVRLPADLYQAGSELARRRKISMNALVQESLAALVRAEEEKRFRDSFTLLGEDATEADVDFAFAFQSEVVLHGEQ